MTSSTSAFEPLDDPRPADMPWVEARWPIDPATVLVRDAISLTLTTPDDAPELFDVKTGITLDEKVDIWVRLLR